MYKIYINETPLLLLHTSETDLAPPADDRHLVARYPGMPKVLLNYADMLEKTGRFDLVALYADDYDKLVHDFWSHYRVIEAAGGVVFNALEEVLLIFRRGHWDLPKGKIDPGETREAAAVREVQEETGLGVVAAERYLGETYHTYRDKKHGRVLKVTYWYVMKTPETELVPETEEDIEKAVWRKPAPFLATNNDPVYPNVLDLLRQV